MPDVLHIRPTSVYRLSDVAADLGVSLRTLQRAVEAGSNPGKVKAWKQMDQHLRSLRKLANRAERLPQLDQE